MQIVNFDQNRHYKAMCAFWKEYDWLPCPICALPKNGRVAENNQNEFIAYMGIYIEPGTIAVIDWGLANPSISNEESHEALHALFDALVDLARKQGCHFIYSFTKNRLWGSRLQSYGMAAAERGATSYIMSLDENTDISFISD
jgi:hypothetical protein